VLPERGRLVRPFVVVLLAKPVKRALLSCLSVRALSFTRSLLKIRLAEVPCLWPAINVDKSVIVNSTAAPTGRASSSILIYE
jgi:hypothetical protein